MLELVEELKRRSPAFRHFEDQHALFGHQTLNLIVVALVVDVSMVVGISEPLMITKDVVHPPKAILVRKRR